MQKLKTDVLLRCLKLVNVLLITVPFAVSWMLFYQNKMYSNPFYEKGNWIIIALFAMVYFLFGRLYDAFLVSVNQTGEIVYSQALAAFMSDCILLVAICLLLRRLPNVLPMLAVFCVQILLSLLWTVMARRWYFHVHPPKRTVLIYDMRQGMDELISKYGLSKKFEVVATCSVDVCISGGMEIFRSNQAEVAYLCGVHSHNRNIILKYCVQNDITVYMLPRIGDVIMSGARRTHMFHLPMLRVDRYSPAPEYLLIKRVFDILVAGVAIVVLSPIMLITALAIRRDGGPALYKQTRLTIDGKEFKVWKFRSMRVDAEKDGVARLSTGEADDRITPVGKVIRKVRIDELPQLFNILGGSMSIVGPRPERPEIAREYEKELPEFSLRLQAKAGLTGLAQVYGKYNTTPYDKLQMDLMYIANPSIIQDVAIMFATVKILFQTESTEGVAEGQITAAQNTSEDSAEMER